MVNKVSEQELYDYLMSKGIGYVKTMGILANIKAESDFFSDAVEVGDMENKGIGLFQHTFPARKKAFLEAVPNWETDWKGQIDFALQEAEAKKYLDTEFDNVSDSTKAFMLDFEKPKDQSEEAIEKRVSSLKFLDIDEKATVFDQNSNSFKTKEELKDEGYTAEKYVEGLDLGEVDNSIIENSVSKSIRNFFYVDGDKRKGKATTIKDKKGDKLSDKEVGNIFADDMRKQLASDLGIDYSKSNDGLSIKDRVMLDMYEAKSFEYVIKERDDSSFRSIDNLLTKAGIYITKGKDSHIEDAIEGVGKRNPLGLFNANLPQGYTFDTRNNTFLNTGLIKGLTQKDDTQLAPQDKDKILEELEDLDKSSDVQVTKDLLNEVKLDDIGEEEENVIDDITVLPEQTTTTEDDAITGGTPTTGGLLDSIGGFSTIASALVGANYLGRSNNISKEISDSPELSDAFDNMMYQQEQASKMGFSPQEEAAYKKQIADSYTLGMENAVRGTGGDRAKYLAMSGVLDAQRQSALLDFAARDEAVQRQNQDRYNQTLMFKENFDIQRQQQQRAEEMEAIATEYTSNQQLAAQAFKYAADNIANAKADKLQNQLIQKMIGNQTNQTEETGLNKVASSLINFFK